ncbi:uncharacterized protein LOC141601261 [Silene latifolia]|uniref:uncharacterized protein LOC141601261 n=1 Tax=Silene latifolia TaxID=37657 RepID=UPI003D7882EC
MAKTRKSTKNTKNSAIKSRDSSGSASKFRFDALRTLEDESTIIDAEEEELTVLPLELPQPMETIREEEGEPAVNLEGQWTEVRTKKKSKTPTPDSGKATLTLSEEDVLPEFNYWASALYGYILGVNPPWNVLSGYLKRIWKDSEVDKISFMPNGIFIVRFKSIDKMREIVKDGHFMFDNKPVIIQEWSPDVDLVKSVAKIVPIWIKLSGLDLKFWGQECLKKISGLIGEYVKCDEPTKTKTFLGFARVLVDVQVGQTFPNSLQFNDEKGKTHHLKVEYDWIPVKCSLCQGIGHTQEVCRRKTVTVKPKQVWQRKVVPKEPLIVPPPKTLDKGKQIAATPVPRATVPHTPARIVTRVMRQDGTASSHQVSGPTFLDALNMAQKYAHMSKGTGRGIGGVLDHETKVKPNSWNKVRNNICSGWAICTNNSAANGGRIWLLWDPGLFDVDIIDVSAQTIHTKVLSRGIRSSSTLLFWGDFNNVLQPLERIGSDVTLAEIRPFQQCLLHCELTDIKAIGSYYTWNNKHDVDTRVYSRIDRCLINADWMNVYPDSYAFFMPEGEFDHCPCVIRFCGDDIKRKPAFKYFNMWALDPNFKQIVNGTWSQHVQGTLMFQERLITQPLNEELIGLENTLIEEYIVAKSACHQFLAQKAKVDWLKLGDENSQYFHSTIRQRRAHNKVFQILDSDGKLYVDNVAIQDAFISFYKGLLDTSKKVDKISVAVIQNGRVLNEAHHNLLMADVTGEEVRKAMFDICGTKAPGPDGYNSQFFKDTWKVTGPGIISAVQDFFGSGRLLKQVNSTLVTLVPKVDAPKDVTQFRPIACCNTIYKCISKVMCGRLSAILLDIISDSQSAFIKGRDIVENILICQDLVKLYNRKACSPRVIMKLDLQKAYDSIEWSFVHDMLHALNFPVHFVNLITECITSPSYTLSLNGDSFGYFKGARGLRQGDPLSPLLFVIYMEYLSRILDQIRDYVDFRYRPLCGRIKLNHLALVDDLLLFCRGDKQSITGLLRAFESFSRASRLRMNKGKSSIYSNGVDKAILDEVLSWAWRKLCRIKELLAPEYIGDWWLHDQNSYSIQSGYEWLKHHPAIAPWFSFTWVKEAVPRHNFIGWLIANERLLTRDRLHRIGITSDISCVLCENAQESHDHLFFKCIYSRRCLDLVATNLGCNLPCTQCPRWWLDSPLLQSSLSISWLQVFLLLCTIFGGHTTLAGCRLISHAQKFWSSNVLLVTCC